jgi:predicted DNA-binding transcriptional regulator AlpA
LIPEEALPNALPACFSDSDHRHSEAGTMSLERALELWHGMPFVAQTGCGGSPGGEIIPDHPLYAIIGEELLKSLLRGDELLGTWAAVKEASRDPGIIWDVDGEPDKTPGGPGAKYVEECKRFRSELQSRIAREPQQYVTLDQIAIIGGYRGKKTLERCISRGEMPNPAIEGGGGNAALWIWSEIRGWLAQKTDRILPPRYPSLTG